MQYICNLHYHILIFSIKIFQTFMIWAEVYPQTHFKVSLGQTYGYIF